MRKLKVRLKKEDEIAIWKTVLGFGQNMGGKIAIIWLKYGGCFSQKQSLIFLYLLKGFSGRGFVEMFVNFKVTL